MIVTTTEHGLSAENGTNGQRWTYKILTRWTKAKAKDMDVSPP